MVSTVYAPFNIVSLAEALMSIVFGIMLIHVPHTLHQRCMHTLEALNHYIQATYLISIYAIYVFKI
ncbi:hypothetical protein BX070DRAFT_222105 [Coemansia spiralis]|nr:hypothetical protein BX070DRAFT_222105 [Coemansia spiralis]